MIDEQEEQEDGPIIRLERLDPEQWWTDDPRNVADLESGAWLGRNVIIVSPEEAASSSLAMTLALGARSSRRCTVAIGHAFESLREAVECGSRRLTDPDVLSLDDMTDLPDRLFECLIEVLSIRAGRSTILAGECEPTIRGLFTRDRQLHARLKPFLTGERCIVVRSRLRHEGE